MTRKHTFDGVFLCSMIFFDVAFFKRVQHKCPDSGGVLYAYPDADLKNFSYTFIRKGFDPFDKFLIDDKEEEVTCTWEIRAKEDHFAAVSFQVFKLLEEEDSKSGDCLFIYDGSVDKGKLVEQLCGSDVPSREPYRGSGRSLFVVFERGERYGERQLSFKYFAISHPKAMIITIAAVVSSVIAIVGLCFLTIKVTHCCRPCRKKWCHAHNTNERPDHHECRPLAPEPLTSGGVVNTRANNWHGDLAMSSASASAVHSYVGISNENAVGNSRIPGSNQHLDSRNDLMNSRNPETLEYADGAQASAPISSDSDPELQSPSADELPPSYDSLFGDNNNIMT